MSQVVTQSVEQTETDPYEIGWYVESADEETYGPVSRTTLGRWLEENAITPNTLVRHCTQPEALPLADQAVLADRLAFERIKSGVGDRLGEAWPRKGRDRLALAEGSLPCVRHKRPAILFCVRCHAPYCNKCRMKPFKKQFFLCRGCQSNVYNRRVGALILDSLLIIYAPMILTVVVVALLGVGQGSCLRVAERGKPLVCLTLST